MIYAIGDIHGCLDQFVQIISLIEADAKEHGLDYRILTLGDYMDRGPNSKGVVDFLMSRPDIIKLRGNHEDMIIQAMAGDRDMKKTFEAHGGVQTMASFGVNFTAHMPMDYVDWLRTNTQMFFEDDLRFFVHAGVTPYHKLNNQPEDVMLWIREPFLSHPAPFEKYIVHGHTPTYQPDVRSNRCGLDTGCYGTGILTCGVFDDSQAKPIRFIQAGATA